MISGSFTLQNRIFEQESSDHQYISIFEPIKIEWSYYEDSQTAHVTYDFGMEYPISMNPEKNCLISPSDHSYVHSDSTIENKIKAVVKFDLFHAFFHYQGDPNYSHLHWALYGNLKNRLFIHENYS